MYIYINIYIYIYICIHNYIYIYNIYIIYVICIQFEKMQLIFDPYFPGLFSDLMVQLSLNKSIKWLSTHTYTLRYITEFFHVYFSNEYPILIFLLLLLIGSFISLLHSSWSPIDFFQISNLLNIC